MKTSAKKRNELGFSLVELLIVILVIGIIAAIAVPKLVNSRMAANEAGTVAAVRLISQVQNSKGLTTDNFASLEQLVVEKQIDDRFRSGNQYEAHTGGYDYLITLIPATATTEAEYVLSAKPSSPSGIMKSGSRRFGVSRQGVIFYSTDNLEDHFTDLNALSLNLPLGEN